MEEALLWAQPKDLRTVIGRLPMTETTLMLLERMPTTWLDEDERRSGLRLEPVDPALDFNQWERGRIFDDTFELRWERSDGAFQTVYCGRGDVELSEFEPAAGELGGSRAEDHCYFLWGTRVQEQDLALIGEPPGSTVFVELQVPRLLHYPVDATAQRAMLCVREYRDPSGALIYYRWRGLRGWHESV